MKKAEIRTPFFKMVEEIILPKGFIKQKNSEGYEYVKQRDNGFIVVNPMIWSYSPLFFISLGFTVRINEMSQILAFINNISDEFSDEYPTTSTDIRSLVQVEDERIRVETEDDLLQGLKFLKEILENQGLQFFKNFQTIADFDKDFNRLNRPKDLHCSEVSTRPFIGLISAVLNNNPQAKYWENYHRESLQNKNKYLKNQYEKLVNYLKENYPGVL
jgi:hypothetical protein